MPIKVRIKPPTRDKSQEEKPKADKRVLRLPIIQPNTARVVIVPPPVRAATKVGAKQLTVLRHDGSGQYFVDKYIEPFATTEYLENRRLIYLNCPVYAFQVCISACVHYCSGPCETHLDAIRQRGWYQRDGIPPYKRRRG